MEKGVDRRPSEAAPYGSYAELLSLREGDILIPRIPNKEPLAIECEEFLKAVLTGIPPRSDQQDGLRVVRVLAAAQEKLSNGQLAFQGAGS